MNTSNRRFPSQPPEGAGQVFTPHHPVRPGGELAGREHEVDRTIVALNTPGLYPVIGGAPGSGRSSLADVAAHRYHRSTAHTVHTRRCGPADTFATILDEPLLAAGLDGLRGEDIGASVAAGLLAGLPAVFVVDDLDLVTDPGVLHEVVEFVEHLSDRAAVFKLLPVGGHGTVDHLAALAQSTASPLRPVLLHPMSDDHLQDIVTHGEKRLGLTFSEEAKAAIAWISAGYPRFTHLLALKCAENALRTGRERVGKFELLGIMDTAAEVADTALRETYRTSTAAQPKVHGELLAIAAALDENEFTPGQLRAAVNGRFDVQGPLGHLASADGPTILRRIGRGVYQFDDPRMRGYVRLVSGMTEPPD